jgi:hypothetical protein
MPKELSDLAVRKKMRKGTHSCFECTLAPSELIPVVPQVSYQSCIYSHDHITLRFTLRAYGKTCLIVVRPPPENKMYIPIRQS